MINKQQTQVTLLQPNFELSATTTDQKLASQIQSELSYEDPIAVEVERALERLASYTTSNPFSFWPQTWETILQRFEPYDQLYHLLQKVEDLTYHHSCPICKTNQQVVKNGKNQRICRANHSNRAASNNFCFFSNTTSYEAIKSIELLGLLVSELLYGNTTHQFISQFIGVSTYFVEFVSSFLASSLPQHSVEDLNLNAGFQDNQDLLVIFSDFSGSRLAKKVSLLVAEINGERIWFLYQCPNSLAAETLMNDLAEQVVKQQFTGQVMVITDGEFSFVDAVRSAFPTAIHIRQFHKKSLLGIIFAHFVHDNQEYTLKFNWDLVVVDSEGLEDKTQAHQVATPTLEKRKWRGLKASQDVKVNNFAENEDEYNAASETPVVSLYEGRIWTSRGKRKSTPQKSRTNCTNCTVTTAPDELDIADHPKIAVQTVDGYQEVESMNSPRSSLDGAVRRGRDCTTVPKKRGRRPDVSKLRFKGSLEQLLHQFPWMTSIYGLIVCVFGGLYITSNRAETPFALKHRLAIHGVMKAGLRHLVMQLGFDRFANLSQLRTWLGDHLSGKELVIHELQRAKSTVLRGNHLKSLLGHLNVGQFMVITYENREGKKSVRVIEVSSKPAENGVFSAYCYLREEVRSFQIRRIQEFCFLEEMNKYLERKGRLLNELGGLGNLINK